jgi:hypothetical protein
MPLARYTVRQCVDSAGALLADLDAFLQGTSSLRRPDAAIEGDRIWMTCTCGAVLVRVVPFG